MGIKKSFVQTMISRALLNPRKDGVIMLEPSVQVADYDIVLVDHSVAFYHMLYKYDKNPTVTEKACITAIIGFYKRLNIPKTSYLVMVQDGFSYPLKVYARQNRSPNKVSTHLKAITDDRLSFLTKVYEEFVKEFPNLVMVHSSVCYGVSRPANAMYVVKTNDAKLSELLNDKSYQGPEVEADLSQMRIAYMLAKAYPNYKIAVVNQDTDMVVIMAALTYKEDMPSNITGFFINDFFDLKKDITAYVSRQKLDLLCKKVSSATTRTPVLSKGVNLNMSEEALLLIADCDVRDRHRVFRLYKTAWQEMLQMLPKPINYKRLLNGIWLNGVRGSLFVRMVNALTLNNYKNNSLIKSIMLNLASGERVDHVWKPLAELTVHNVKESDCRYMTMLNRFVIPFGTFGEYLNTTDHKMVPFRIVKRRASLYMAVLGILAGTDYSIPVHNYGLAQLLDTFENEEGEDMILDALYNDIADVLSGDQIWPKHEMLTGQFLAREFIPNVCCLDILHCEATDLVFDIIAWQVKHIFLGWVIPGYFWNLYNDILLNKSTPGYIYIKEEDGCACLDFAVPKSILTSYKSNVKLRYHKALWH
uniref:Uncharacterized protein n=1 Tax=Ranid herpesvirus 4 TaxID=2849006 RepID=A0A8F3CIH9_9VIRU|nr:MAG: hypothetical protein [Ranid herpesvirus 4]